VVHLQNFITLVQLNNWFKRNIQLSLCFIREKPIAQIAHLVFAETEANAEKPKELFFSQRLKKLKN